MPTTVHFATNRVVNGPPETLASYTSEMISPTKPEEATYGTAFIDNSDLTADTVGAITSIQDTRKGGFSQGAMDDLSDGGAQPSRFHSWFRQQLRERNNARRL
jgi:hypothetical protein